MKKSLRKSMMLFLIVSLLITNISVGVNSTTVSAKTKIKLNKTKATLIVGKTLKLKIKRTKKKVKWSSSNKKIATVTSKGKVKAKKKGKVVITAKIGKKKYKCKITVKNKPIPQKQPNTTNNIKDSRLKLINYIKDNGEKTDSGNYELKSDIIYDIDSNGSLHATQNILSIDNKLSKISFTSISVSDAGSKTMSVITFGIESSNATIYSAYEYKEIISYIGTYEFTISQFDKNENLIFSLTNNLPEQDENLDNSIQTLFNNTTKFILSYANTTIMAKLNICLKDIGFNY